jgi:hypothetical protein
MAFTYAAAHHPARDKIGFPKLSCDSSTSEEPLMLYAFSPVPGAGGVASWIRPGRL